ncbi:sigma 54-interacting transcriptional regulator [Enterococcus hulanensis]|uniref:sigma 54-interacting transcriptional regulator n=1 Tax=Enterococcus hulanensis TaxID=2559929 RepID=UPI001A8E83C9|nr:sigma 54-interacting transcriptional regulator [Enterococcus hulanensis]MBO0458189.1 sigma 54-interacting transcriptional regulator [Enterococcus hulanensis]
MSKKKVLEILKSNTEKIEKINADDHLTAEGISEIIGIQRNTTSQYLNEFVKEGLAIKVKSRPALFYYKDSFRQIFFEPKLSVYDSFNQLIEERRNSDNKNSEVFSSVIGAHSSLQMVIDQIKASMYYPGTGLPIMFHGDTGVGKSLLARKTYEFCVDQGLIESDAPYLELNCAQYYHNEELLSSILFGYKKGAFTGAEESQIGLLESADQGVLFLDECHRLSPESQEKLFTFIDNQTFSRMGENNKTRKSKVRLIFATTEDIQDNFLRTFVRRIPITINIPSLQERTNQEISEYIYTFLIQESHQFNKEILVTPWIMNRLMSLSYRDNVGELKNLIKIICAGAYGRQKNQKQVTISAESLEESLMSRFLSLKEIDNIEETDILILPDSQLSDYIRTDTAESLMINGIFKVFERMFQQYHSEEVTEDYLVQQLSREATTVVEMLVYEDKEEKNTLKLLRNTIKELVNFLESSFFVKMRGNSIVALTGYLYKRGNFIFDMPKLVPKQLEEIKEFISINLLMESKLLNALLELVESKLDVTLTDSEKVLLTFYLKGLDLEVKKPEVRGVILAHGFSTASSIADVVNRFMDEHLFDAFDMPFNVSLEKVKDYMNHYIKNNDCSKGLVILADMGSLMFLADSLEYLSGPLLIMNNVTTQQALFVGEMLKKKTDLEIIAEKISNNMPFDYKMTYPAKEKELMIITVCQTGLGAAQQLKEFLQSSIPEETGFHVEAVDYHYLKKYGRDNSLFKMYEVQGVVGTADPGLPDTPYVALEDLISGHGQEIIDRIFAEIRDDRIRKVINDNLVRNLSIERLISAVTILDVKRVISYIDEVMDRFERHAKFTLSNSKKAILYVHIAGLVERLIRNQEVTHYEGKMRPQDRKLMILSESLETLESAYNIEISEYELNYLYDIIFDC